jgi:hypothetical protein
MDKSFARLALLSLLIASTPSRAETVMVNVCQDIIESVLVPPTFKQAFSCPMDARCIFLPHCCVPLVCVADPVCRVASTVVDVAQHVEQRHTLVCQPTPLDPAVEFKKWMAGGVPNLDEVLVPGARQTAKAEIGLMRTQGTAIPAGAKAVIGGLMQSEWTKGTAQFDQVDMNGIAIISNTNSLAKPYLRSGFSAITLGAVIVIDDPIFRTIMGNWNALAMLKATPGQHGPEIAAAHTLMHELVHAKQYRMLGFDAFINQYLFEAIEHGYANISFEVAAYTYADNLFAREFPPTSSSNMQALTSGSTLNRTQTVSVLQQCMKNKKPANDAQMRSAAQACWSEASAKYRVANMGTNKPELKLVQDPRGRLIPVVPRVATPPNAPRQVFVTREQELAPAQQVAPSQQMAPAPGRPLPQR